MTMGRTRRSAGSTVRWSEQAASAVVATGVPTGQRVDRDACPECGAWMKRPWPMYMPTWPRPSKKTRSPGTEASARDAAAELELRARVVRQRDPEVRVDEAGEPRAVEAVRRRGAAVGVADAQVVPGEAHDLRLLARDRGRVADPHACAAAAPARERTHARATRKEQRKAGADGHRKGPFGRGGARRENAPGCRWPAQCARGQGRLPSPFWGMRHPPKGVGRPGSADPGRPGHSTGRRAFTAS